MTDVQNKHVKTRSYQEGRWEENDTPVICEKSVSLTVNGEFWLTFMCTPVDLESLAGGFLYNEEIIQRKEDIASIRVCPTKDNVDVWLNLTVKKPDIWVRTSGCSGGETSIDEQIIYTKKNKTFNGNLLPAQKIGSLIQQLGTAQKLYRISGGVHTSAISDGHNLLVVAEDIGRHNTLDKLAGRCLLEDIHPARIIILTTGRVSSEMIQKSSRIGASIVITRTSPSSLSVQMAETIGITLIGYANVSRFTIYSHPERILSTQPAKLINCEEA
jgi:FdhD protein